MAPTTIKPKLASEIQAAANGDAGRAELISVFAGLESGGGYNLDNGTGNSCTGALQFSDGTYAKMLAEIAGRDPAIADEMRRQGKNSDYSQVHACSQYIDDNAKLLQSHGLEATGVNLYMAHFIGPGAAVKTLQASDGTPMSSIVSADAVKGNPILGRMNVGEFKAFEKRNLENRGMVSDFAIENDFLNPTAGKQTDLVLKNLHDNGHAEEADKLKGLLADKKTHHQGMVGLRDLNGHLIDDAKIDGVDHNKAEAMHLAQKFGAPDAIKILKAGDDKKLSELGISPDAIAAYREESAKDLADAASKDPALKAALDKKPDELTVGDMKQIGKGRATAYNQQIEGMRTRTGSRGHGSKEDEELDSSLQNMMVNAAGNMGIGGLLMLLFVALLAPNLLSGSGGGQSQGNGHDAPAAAPVTAGSPDHMQALANGVGLPPSITGGSHIETGTPVVATGPGNGGPSGGRTA